MDILEVAAARFTLVGIMHVEDHGSREAYRGKRYRLHPVVGVPGIDDGALATVIAFEKANAIARHRI
jgi:hypothetical protein